MSQQVTIDELESYIGKETGTGKWFKIDQDRINMFADTTEDHQFIHIDPERAKDTMFGSTIAHGFLTLSMMPHLCEGAMLDVKDVQMGINYGFDKMRFMTPVKVDSRIRAVVVLQDVKIKGGGKRALLTSAVTLEIEGEKRPALVCEWLTMVMM